jgi:hypothetical protein
LSPTKAPDSRTVVILFVAGAGLVIASFTYAFIRRWPTFDPLVTAAIVGVGLLLIVIYERLGRMYTELRTIAYHLQLLSGGPHDRVGTMKHSAGASEGPTDAR